MSLLLILRSADCADAAQVIQAQLVAGVSLTVVLEGAQEVPKGTTVYSLGTEPLPGTEPIDAHGLVGLVFAADSVVIW